MPANLKDIVGLMEVQLRVGIAEVANGKAGVRDMGAEAEAAEGMEARVQLESAGMFREPGGRLVVQDRVGIMAAASEMGG